MEKIIYRKLLVPLLFLALMVALMINCGGGGGGGSSAVSASGTGTVAVYLTDSPADDYAEINILITEVSLIPENGGAPVVIFEKPSGVWRNLLALRDEEVLFHMRRDVPAGTYSKIRLGVSDIEAVAKPNVTATCTDMEIKLPSGKIDLNPQAPFRVVPGGVLSITLDVDACKSINLHPTGSGKCIFRPVVFVDITEGFKTVCPQILRGTIVALYINPTAFTIDGFNLKLNDTETYLDVSLPGDARVFGTAGEFITNPSVLREGQDVRVRGNFNASGDFETSFVIIGDVLKVAGIVDTVSAGQFSMTALEGEAIVGPKTVEIFDETLILLDRCNEVSVAMIQAGMRARVFAKEVGSNLNAAIVILDITGRIDTLQSETGGKTVTIHEEIGEEPKASVAVFIPDDTPVDIEGVVNPENGSYLCAGRYVRILLDPPVNGDPLTAKKIFVPLDQYSGTVNSISGRTLNITSISFGVGSVVVPTDAAIYDITSGSQVPADFDDIATGDAVAFSGLWGCSGGFAARVVQIVK